MRLGAFAIATLVAACGGGNIQTRSPRPNDAHTAPAVQDAWSAYGNTKLHVWWPLTPPEVAALEGADKARAGDPHALLALAIFASADRRDAESYARYRSRLDAFVADVRPTIQQAPDAWRKAYELHRAMHRVFMGGERGDLGGYVLEQATVTGLFDTRRYNCLSSAILYAVLARSFDLSVRGVVLPTHAFIEIGPPGMVHEVETTSDTGFDRVHDERFYVGQADWSAKRGLRPMTMDDYRQRKIVEPYRLIADDMRHDATIKRSDEESQSRLFEASAFLDGDNVDAVRSRMARYVNLGTRLTNEDQWSVLLKMMDVVHAPIQDAGVRFAGDPKTKHHVLWLEAYFAGALDRSNRRQEAFALAEAMVDRVDDNVEEAPELRKKFTAFISNWIGELTNRNEFERATQAASKHIDLCRAHENCTNNLSVSYGNWALLYMRAGDWQNARRVLQECVARLPNVPRCSNALAELEAQHRF